MLRTVLVLAAVSSTLSGCGRTQPYWYEADAGFRTALGPGLDGGSCVADRDCNDHLSCITDSCQPNGTCLHVANDAVCAEVPWCTGDVACDLSKGCVVIPRHCADGVSCHRSSCDETRRVCVNTPDDALCVAQERCGPQGCTQCLSASDCDAQIACVVDQCVDGTCVHTPNDSLCGTGNWCDGDFACDPGKGCVVTPRHCDDGVSCDVNSCDSVAKACVHTPKDSLCAQGLLCGPSGCAVFAYAVTSDTLYDVELPSGTATAIGGPSRGYSDIALDPDGNLYGTDGDNLDLVDRKTGANTFIADGMSSMNALDAAPDGTLYGAGAGGPQVWIVSRQTAAQTVYGSLPPGFSSSGDIALVRGEMYISAVGDMALVDTLVHVGVSPQPSQVIGPIGFTCVYGLAAYGPKLYGFTCNGEVLEIDVTTGNGTLLAKTALSFTGASAR